MGWSNLELKKETAFIKKLKTKLEFEKVSAYFVHSYNFLTKNENNKVMTTDYEQEITAMVSQNNIIGTQFHPEKSNFFGLIFLETFLELEKILMNLYPAIDLKDGKCIRLTKGKLEKLLFITQIH